MSLRRFRTAVLFAAALTAGCASALLTGCATTPDGPLLRAPFRLLMIGDSHYIGKPSDKNLRWRTNAVGLSLDERLRKIPKLEVYTYAGCNAGAEHFFTGLETHCGGIERTPFATKNIGYPNPYTLPQLNALMAKTRPDAVIIALGADMFRNASERMIKHQVLRLVSHLKPQRIPCIWLRPPSMRKIPMLADESASQKRRDEVENWIQEALTSQSDIECEFLETESWVDYPDQGGDGIHYQSLGAAGSDFAEVYGIRGCRKLSWLLFGREAIECENPEKQPLKF